MFFILNSINVFILLNDRVKIVLCLCILFIYIFELHEFCLTLECLRKMNSDVFLTSDGECSALAIIKFLFGLLLALWV